MENLDMLIVVSSAIICIWAAILWDFQNPNVSNSMFGNTYTCLSSKNAKSAVSVNKNVIGKNKQDEGEEEENKEINLSRSTNPLGRP